MMRIDDTILMAYVDDELDAEEARRVAAALEHDPEAQARVRLLRESASLAQSLFSTAPYEQVSPVVARAASGSAPRKAPPRRWRIALPLAASIIGAVLFAGGFLFGEFRGGRQASFSERLLDEVADYHAIYAMEDEHQVEVSAQRIAHIETWLGDRLHRKLKVPDLSDRGLIFQGARLLVVDGHRVAQLLYHWPDRPHEPFALCISPGGHGEREFMTDRRQGLSLVVWRSKGYSYVVAGWAETSLLRDIASELSPQLDRT